MTIGIRNDPDFGNSATTMVHRFQRRQQALCKHTSVLGAPEPSSYTPISSGAPVRLSASGVPYDSCLAMPCVNVRSRQTVSGGRGLQQDVEEHGCSWLREFVRRRRNLACLPSR